MPACLFLQLVTMKFRNNHGVLGLLLTLLLLLTKLPESSAVDCNTTLNDLFPEWDSALYSCQDRCEEDYTGATCACDHACHTYGDCCEDVDDFCPLPEDNDPGN
ncbi:hypothetical protein BaRGS_00026171 [Batillaria attramentaria]|uniref:SMB domain-containing protein n=1 Tax=Batillaria attramentaria TaxID=370345 RepID=A0ABD0K590_9CAEN